MTVNNGSLVSGRVPVTAYANLTADRYQFLGLAQAEPNLGPGANNTVLVITTNNTRSWSDSLTLTGNVSANYFIGNGSQLTGIFTTITNQTFEGDGSTIVFTLNTTATAVSILITINGIAQTPDVDYLVISNLLTFTSAPSVADVIQVRFLSNNAVSGTYSNSDVAAFLPTYTGDITAANISATGNIQGQYILGNGAFLSGISGGGQANIIYNGSSNVSIPDVNSNVVVSADGAAWTFVTVGTLTLPPTSTASIEGTDGNDVRIRAISISDPVSASLENYNGSATTTSVAANPDTITLSANTNTWTFADNGNLTFPQGGYIGAAGVKGDGTMLTGGNGQITSLTSYYSSGMYSSCVTANPDGTLNITTYGDGTGINGQWQFANGNLTLPPGGNLIVSSGSIVGDGASPAPSISGFDSIGAITLSASGNVVADGLYQGNIDAGGAYFSADANGTSFGIVAASGIQVDTGGIYITSTGGVNIYGVAGSQVYLGGGTSGNITVASDIDSANAISASYFVGDGSQLTNVATSTTGSWTLAAGTNTVSLTVPGPGTYSIWVNGNIPNGIITYTATVVVTNNNVPVVGSQYGWYYLAGNALVLTAMPNQVVGTSNTISTATVSTTTADVFTFGITNNSGSAQVVNWGYTRL